MIDQTIIIVLLGTSNLLCIGIGLHLNNIENGIRDLIKELNKRGDKQ